MKKNCLFVVQSHYPESHYMELNLELVFPFYLVTDGEKTIIERKIDELLDKYDGDIFTSIGGMETFRDAYGGQITVALIREHNTVRKRALDG